MGLTTNGVGLAVEASLKTDVTNDYVVPAGRGAWIANRKAEAERTGDTNMSQMHFARKGVMTEEMAVYRASKEKISARAGAQRSGQGAR